MALKVGTKPTPGNWALPRTDAYRPDLFITSSKKGDKMPSKNNNAESYNTGKKNEKNSKDYYTSLGYVKVKSSQRKIIADAMFRHFGVDPVKMGKGFDLIAASDAAAIDEGSVESVIHDMILYELKTAGAKRKTSLKDGFNGMGFTASEAEVYLSEKLGEDKYKVLLIDLKKESHLITTMQNILSKARVYPTFSVFVNEALD